MNDHHLDPPEEYEPDLDNFESYLRANIESNTIAGNGDVTPTDKAWSHGVAKGLQMALDALFPTYPEPDYSEPDYSEPDWENHYIVVPKLCPHDNEWHECDACDHASDIAYDAAREGRGR